MGKNDESITITREQLAELVATTTAAAIAAFQAQVPAAAPAPPDTLDERLRSHMAAIRGTDREAPPVASFHVRSRDTGATFTLLTSRGLCKFVENYTHPAGLDLHRSEGGLVPDGLPIKLATGAETPQFKTWKWKQFWKHDLQRHIDDPNDFVRKDEAWLRANADVLSSSLDAPPT